MQTLYYTYNKTGELLQVSAPLDAARILWEMLSNEQDIDGGVFTLHSAKP